MFADAVKAGGSVRLINLDGYAADFPRKKIDKLQEYVKTYRAKGLAWTRSTKAASRPSYAKFLTEAEQQAILERAGAKDGDLVLIVADAKDETVFASLGALRCECARQLGILNPNDFKFLWVTEFPMFEWSEEEGRYMAMHHPFTAPMEEDADKILTDKKNCRARAYDIVLNGCELGGGSIRINTPEMQEKAFEALGISEEDIQERFGHLVGAFKFGAPPHGGLAYGLDRLVMLMTGAESIRDVIAFPKVQTAADLMMACPDLCGRQAAGRAVHRRHPQGAGGAGGVTSGTAAMRPGTRQPDSSALAAAAARALCMPAPFSPGPAAEARIAGAAEDVVGGSLVEIRQGNEDVRGNVPVSLLIAEVLGLRHMEIGGHLPLGEIVVFPAVPGSVYSMPYRMPFNI